MEARSLMEAAIRIFAEAGPAPSSKAMAKAIGVRAAKAARESVLLLGSIFISVWVFISAILSELVGLVGSHAEQKLQGEGIDRRLALGKEPLVGQAQQGALFHHRE